MRIFAYAARTRAAIGRKLSTSANARTWSPTARVALGVGMFGVGTGVALMQTQKAEAWGKKSSTTPITTSAKGMPQFRLSEVRDHYNRDTGTWVTFRGGVYDVTSFLDGHPGGTTRLLMAGGNDLTPFWDVYRQHYRGHILGFLEKFRIGNLDQRDAEEAISFTFGDAYETDPVRHPDLLGCTKKPWCGEPRIELLTQSYYTPNELFYVRNHLPVPVIDPEDWVVEVSVPGHPKREFSLNDIKTKFPKYEVTSTLQCAGNRREDLHGARGIFISPHWVVGAISNAKWGGARLRDVLTECGMDVERMAQGIADDTRMQHVQFEGYDEDETGLTFGGSIPIDKAVDPLGDCLIAYEMNNRPVPRDHGGPGCRALAPGHVGARQVKWLNKVIVSDKESNRPWHQKSYRGFAPDITFEDHLSKWNTEILRLDQAPIAQEMPVQSIVCNPSQNTVIGGKGLDEIVVKGVAWSGGGRGINRVDVSIDGGKHFTAAELYKPIKQRRNRQWGWYLWEKVFQLPQEVKDQIASGRTVTLDLTSKAVNGDFNVQPEFPEAFWNARGICINHWYHVNVTLEPTIKASKGAETEWGNTPTGGQFNIPWSEHGWGSEDSQKAARTIGKQENWRTDRYPS